jgi:diguanylate cyclase (GGDEF)-like protein/PAS domain S-box-containing protein
MAGAQPPDTRFSTIFRLCPVGLAVTEKDGRLIEANPALAQLLETTPEQMAGRRLLDYTHPDDQAISVQVGQSVMDRQRDQAVLDKRYVTDNGTVIPVRLTMIALDEPGSAPHKLVQIDDLREQRATEADLRRQAQEDPLTGLANRRALQDELEPLLGDVHTDGAADGAAAPRARQPDRDGSAPSAATRSTSAPSAPAAPAPSGPPPPRVAETTVPRDPPATPIAPASATWAVLYVDLDDFKSINDQRGHRFGDQVLVAVAGRLAGVTRDDDLVARVGGDEFVVLLRVAAEADVRQAQARIRRSLAQPIRVEGEQVRISASVGYALPRHDDSTQQVLDRADEAMYRDKTRTRSGR